MKNTLPQNVVKFADSYSIKTETYKQFIDYFAHHMDELQGMKITTYDKSRPLMGKEKLAHQKLVEDVKRMSGVNFEVSNIDPALLATNPNVRWAAFGLVGSYISAVLPMVINQSTGIFTEIGTVGYGDSRKIDIEPNSLFTVSEAGNGQRNTFAQKQFKTTKSLEAINHEITVTVSLYRVLAGLENLAEFVRKAIISINREMTKDAYETMRTGLNAIPAPANDRLVHVGYDEKILLQMCQTVEAYNNGAKPVIIGAAMAIRNVIPDPDRGNRIVSEADNIRLELIRNFFGYDILVLPQIATGDYTTYDLALNDNELYVVSPASGKLVQGVIEGSALTNTDSQFDNANLTEEATMFMRWNYAFMTNSTAAIMKLA